LIATAAPATIAHAQETHAPHWGYQGEAGPAHWGAIDDAYEACAIGQQQSPIDIPADLPPTGVDLAFDYEETGLHIANNGHTILVAYDPGSAIRLGGKIFAVAQFHFHVPSEHTIEGVAAPLEMHIVHQAADGALAVIGVLFDFAEDDNPFLAEFWDDLPAEGEIERPGSINIAAAFDPAGPFFAYPGSLTTPPCSEGVSWLVMADHQTVSKEQVADFVAILGLNARPTQPANTRLPGH